MGGVLFASAVGTKVIVSPAKRPNGVGVRIVPTVSRGILVHGLVEGRKGHGNVVVLTSQLGCGHTRGGLVGILLWIGTDEASASACQLPIGGRGEASHCESIVIYRRDGRSLHCGFSFCIER